MKKAAWALLMVLLLAGTASGAEVKPDIIRGALVTTNPLSQCQPGYAFIDRDPDWPPSCLWDYECYQDACPPDVFGDCEIPVECRESFKDDVCSEVNPFLGGLNYAQSPVDYHGNTVGGVGGVFIPAGLNTGANGWPACSGTGGSIATDGPGYDRPCFDLMHFVNNDAQDYRDTGFSYVVFDLGNYVGCTVSAAVLSFVISPYYSGSAQEDQPCGSQDEVTAYMDVHMMKSTCEQETWQDVCSSAGTSYPKPLRNCYDTDERILHEPFCFPLYFSTHIAECSTTVAPNQVTVVSGGERDGYLKYQLPLDINSRLAPGSSGYVGFVFRTPDPPDVESMAYAPGMRGLGLTDIELKFETDCYNPQTRPCSGPGPAPAPQDAVAVPALTLWGAGIFLLMLLCFAVLALRRRASNPQK